ncbi:MAG: DNA polymerase III subunit gamma/tau [Clostridia bacterium]|nr:DNA polymerase III subunit gamma/tau [Clostridia bacterium]
MYQALYRVWRPRKFSDMVGQESIVRTLTNQVSAGRIAHAYLFCGSRGTGKTSAAKIMARAINCENPQHGDPCCECNSCRMIESDTSFDVFEMDAASNSRVDEIRELLEKVDYPPQFGKYKVYIIDEVHMLSNSAFNALLKTLEEPPEYMVFILATTEPQKLPSTILSRCQRYDFGRFTESQITGHLKKVAAESGVEAEEDALALIARAAEGGMRDALSILDMCIGGGEKVTEESVRSALGAADRAFLFQFTGALCDKEGGEALRLIDKMMMDGRDVQVFLKDLSAHLRLLMAARLCGADETVPGLGGVYGKRYLAQAQKFSQERLLRALELCMKAEGDTRWASSGRSVLEIFALRVCEQPEERDYEALLERIGELELKIEELEKRGVAAPAAAPDFVPKIPKRAEKVADAPIVETPVPQGSKAPKDVWNDALKLLRRNAPMVFAPLSQAKYGGYQDGLYRAVFHKEQKFFLDMLQNDERRKLVEDALNQSGGINARFEAVHALPQADPQAQKMADDNLDALIGTFGRDKVTVE